MKKLFFLLIVFIMINAQTLATTWVQVGDFEYIDKDNITYYINDCGHAEFDKKVYWMKTINNKSSYIKDVEKTFNKKIAYSNAQHIIDINRKSYTIKSITDYDENGDVVASYSYQDFELKWYSIVPDSNGEIWFELVKKPKLLKRIYKIQQEKACN